MSATTSTQGHPSVPALYKIITEVYCSVNDLHVQVDLLTERIEQLEGATRVTVSTQTESETPPRTVTFVPAGAEAFISSVSTVPKRRRRRSQKNKADKSAPKYSTQSQRQPTVLHTSGKDIRCHLCWKVHESKQCV
jgi:uncharacterized coiled-coil protein SlyX